MKEKIIILTGTMSCRTLKFFSSLFIFSFAQSAFALEWSDQSELSLFPDYASSRSFSDSQVSAQENLFFTANTKLTALKEGATFVFMPEVRSLQSSTDLNPASRAAVDAPSRLLNMSWNLNSNSRNDSVASVERVNLDYRAAGAELSIGRKPVSLGVLSVFPVWNKFSRPLITDFGPLRVFGQDQATLRYQYEAWSGQALDIEQGSPNGAARIAEGAWYGENLELHALAGNWWNSNTWGIAAVKDIAGVSVKTEGVWFANHGWQVGLGGERALNEKWSVLSEFFYQEEGALHKEDYLALVLTPSPFRALLARYYGYARLEYKPQPLWTVQAGGLFNLIDQSQLWDAKVIYSLTDNTDLSAEARAPQGDRSAELSDYSLPLQIIVGARWVF